MVGKRTRNVTYNNHLGWNKILYSEEGGGRTNQDESGMEVLSLDTFIYLNRPRVLRNCLKLSCHTPQSLIIGLNVTIYILATPHENQINSRPHRIIATLTHQKSALAIKLIMHEHAHSFISGTRGSLVTGPVCSMLFSLARSTRFFIFQVLRHRTIT